MHAKRAKKGSTPRRLLLPLPAELDDAARADAAAEQISVAEWWRKAGRAYLRRHWPTAKKRLTDPDS